MTAKLVSPATRKEIVSKSLAHIVIISLSITQPATGQQLHETLPVLKPGQTLSSFEDMWAGFDPRAEPLETKVLHEWEEDGVLMRVVRFRIGVFKGKKATLVAIYGFPQELRDSKIPGLVQIHGGGQYADSKACLMNAKRGYATVSIAWAGRISAPKYRVSPQEVQLFWDGKTDDPAYRITTDWGAVDGYHAPGRNKGNIFPSAKPAAWTLDDVESPRNSGWFLCALAARRALTFLERQPEVDPDRLGVYGHSMGGKLTVMTAVDPRVKAAAPSCGGISDRGNDSELFRATIGDDASLKHVKCPIVFLSPSNDFHGRIGDLPAAVDEIQSTDWRVTCSPHHNHQDTPPYEVATLLWFDQHLQGRAALPRTPQTKLQLANSDGVPTIVVAPGAPDRIQAVDVWYTQDGKMRETRFDRIETMHRFWHHVSAVRNGNRWHARLPLTSTNKPLFVYANVRYPLEEPVSGAGYYYGIYKADSFNLSSLVHKVPASELMSANVQSTLKPSRFIESFTGDWRKAWFSYRSSEWAITTHKVRTDAWAAPANTDLQLEVQSDEANKFVVLIDDTYAAEAMLTGGAGVQTLRFGASDFRNYEGDSLPSFLAIRRLKLTHAQHLRPAKRGAGKPKMVGGGWRGPDPNFRSLKWVDGVADR